MTAGRHFAGILIAAGGLVLSAACCRPAAAQGTGTAEQPSPDMALAPTAVADPAGEGRDSPSYRGEYLRVPVLDPFRSRTAASGLDIDDSPMIVRGQLGSPSVIAGAVDFMALKRELGRQAPLLESSDGTSLLLSTRNFDFPIEYNTRISVMALGMFEVNYFGITGWSRSRQESDPAGMMFVPLGSLVPADTAVQVDYRSRFYSTEFNLWGLTHGSMQALLGFRWIELHEELVSTQIDPSGGSGTQLLNVNLDNHLYGLQSGFGGTLFGQGARLHLDGVAKFGIFTDYADTGISSSASPGFEGIHGRRTHAVLVGEAGLTGVFEITKMFAVRVGYEILWIDGLALAPNQISNLGAAPNPRNDGTLLLHGAHAGLELRF